MAKKYLKIIEFSRLNSKIPKKESFSHDIGLQDGGVVRSFIQSDVDDYNTNEIKKAYDTIYNNKILDRKIIPLDDIVIYDELNIDKSQKLAYVLECPICRNNIITSSSNRTFACPHCGNSDYEFKLLAIVDIEQMNEIAIDNDDVSTLIVVKDGNLELYPRQEI